MPGQTPTRALLGHALALGLLLAATGGAARAQDAPLSPPLATPHVEAPLSPEANAAHVREIKRVLLAKRRNGYFRERAEREGEYREARERAALAAKRRAKGRRAAAGERLKPAVTEALSAPGASSAARHLATEAVAAVPGNVRVNDPFVDGPGITQSEPGLAALGNDVLVAWNDGQGAVSGGDYIGWGFSFNGGTSFKDGGTPPHPPGLPDWRWASDPVVTVDEKSGEFYLSAVADMDAFNNAVGVAAGHFVDTVFVWDRVVVARASANTTAIHDKPWIAADSSGTGGRVFIAYATFIPGGDQIDFQRSLDSGVTWSAPLVLSNPADNGYVQGVRPAVGPAGDVYVAWEADQPATSWDYIKTRTSHDHGASFGAEVQAVTYYRNDGTGAPGFNRPLGISFPSIAVDRSAGLHRGRVYLAWNESYDWIDNNPFGGSSITPEVEPNNAASNATPFVPGDVLRGITANVLPTSAPDLDWWKFSLAAGQSIIVYCDSVPAGQTYALRIFAPIPDSAQRLCYGGDDDPTDSASPDLAIYTFTAPHLGTYFLRFAPLSGTAPNGTPFIGVSGGYRIRTRIANPGGRARDQRDVYATFSDNGTSWAGPWRMNDDDVGYDDFLPEIAVGADGLPYSMWFDFRNDASGSRAHQYVSRSTHFGFGWEPSQRITGAAGNFTLSASNIIPNMGDYNALRGDARWLRAAWADARAADVDTWSARMDMTTQLQACSADTTQRRGSVVPLIATLVNGNPLFTNGYTVTVTSARNWPLPPPVRLLVDPGSGVMVRREIVAPDTAALGTNTVCLRVASDTGTPALVCCHQVTITAGTLDASSPAAGLELAPVAPNPAAGAARLAYTLPRTGSARLAVYGLRGERVRTLADGVLPAGPGSARWDGLDDHGRPAGAGIYFVRLEAQGRSLTRRLVWLR